MDSRTHHVGMLRGAAAAWLLGLTTRKGKFAAWTGTRCGLLRWLLVLVLLVVLLPCGVCVYVGWGGWMGCGAGERKKKAMHDASPRR